MQRQRQVVLDAQRAADVAMHQHQQLVAQQGVARCQQRRSLSATLGSASAAGRHCLAGLHL